jgi:hypothetical protein
MAIQTINIGNLVNDGLGDDLRTAFVKVNSNFSALDNELAVTGKNIGASGVNVFKQKTLYELELRKIGGSSNITVTEVNDTIQISSPLQNLFSTIAVSNGSVVAGSATDTLTLTGGNNITITRSGNTINFEADLIDTQLQNDLDLNSYDIVGTGNINIAGSITATNYLGNISGYNVEALARAVYDIDFGYVVLGRYDNAIQFVIANGDYDFGTILAPSEIDLDLDTI